MIYEPTQSNPKKLHIAFVVLILLSVVVVGAIFELNKFSPKRLWAVLAPMINFQRPFSSILFLLGGTTLFALALFILYQMAWVFSLETIPREE